MKEDTMLAHLDRDQLNSFQRVQHVGLRDASVADTDIVMSLIDRICRAASFNNKPCDSLDLQLCQKNDFWRELADSFIFAD